MIKFAVLNDLHLADNSPLGRVPGYQDQLFDKLLGVATTMQSMQIDNLICTGDIFHVKRPDRVSHALVNRLVDTLKNDFEASIYICPGNHDLTEAGIASLNRQPLGVLFQTEVADPLIKDEGYTFFGGSGSRESILLIGRHFDTDGDFDPLYYVTTESEDRIRREHNAKTVIMVAHGSIVPPEAKPIYPHISASQIPWEDGPFVPDVLLCGHLHEDWGVHKLRNGPIYSNLGSFGRPSRNQKNVNTRNFLVMTIDGTKITMEQVPIPNMLPAGDVFFEKVEEQEDEALAEFAEQLASSIILEETSLDEALNSLGDIAPKVKARLRYYLEAAGI